MWNNKLILNYATFEKILFNYAVSKIKTGVRGTISYDGVFIGVKEISIYSGAYI